MKNETVKSELKTVPQCNNLTNDISFAMQQGNVGIIKATPRNGNFTVLKEQAQEKERAACRISIDSRNVLYQFMIHSHFYTPEKPAMFHRSS